MAEIAATSRWLRAENILLACVLGILAWAPFPYGSNRMWAELVLGLAIGATLFLWTGAALTGLATVSSLIRKLVLPGLCIAFALLWALFQCTDLSILEKQFGLPLTALGHKIWMLASTALNKNIGVFITVDPEKTRQALLASSLSVAMFFLAFNLARDRERANVMMNGIICITLGYAVFAILAFGLELDLQSWLLPDQRPLAGRLAGPFANPNHFAAFIGLGAIAALGTFVESVRQSVVWDRGSKVLIRTFLHALTAINAVRLIALIVLLSALLFTQSRAAAAALIAGVLALTVMLSRGRDITEGDATGRRAIIAVMVAVLGVSVAISADPLLNRVQNYGLSDSTRSAIFGSTVEAILTAPLTGHGFGAFERYYPFFSDGTVPGTVDEAHNDILETLADLGLPAGLAFLAAPAWLAWYCFQGVARRRRDRVYPAVALAAAVAVTVHACVDFGLQIPAVAITFAALMGMGVAQSWRTNMDAVR